MPMFMIRGNGNEMPARTWQPTGRTRTVISLVPCPAERRRWDEGSFFGICWSSQTPQPVQCCGSGAPLGQEEHVSWGPQPWLLWSHRNPLSYPQRQLQANLRDPGSRPLASNAKHQDVRNV